jgi:DNA-3-methyladenine glycosylase I
LNIKKEFWSFSKYIWDFVWGAPIKNKFKNLEEIPSSTDISDKISKDLKKGWMSFVWSTIMYAFMQAMWMVNDHEQGCFRYNEV